MIIRNLTAIKEVQAKEKGFIYDLQTKPFSLFDKRDFFSGLIKYIGVSRLVLSCGHISEYCVYLQMQKRELTDLDDLRLLYGGNKILSDLFSKSYQSIRQITKNDSSAKGFYRFCRMTG